MVTNRRMVDLSGADFYPTPSWGTKALLDNEVFNGSIWEPCCGEGDISEVLISHGLSVESSDLYDRGYGLQLDAFNSNKTYDNIITNPPYNIAEKLLEHFLNIYNEKVALLVRTAFLESKKRYTLFQEHPPATIHIFSQRLSMYPKGYPVKGGGTTSYSWIVWEKNNKNPPKVNWIAPIYSKKD